MKTLTLYCQLNCGRVVGEVELATEMTQEEYRNLTGIVDLRCSQCEIDYGTFKELSQKYMQETGSGPQEAEQFVVENPTRNEFDTALQVMQLSEVAVDPPVLQ